MSDRRIDDSLRQVSQALADAAPQPPRLPAGARGDLWGRWALPAAVGFAAALVLGIAGLALVTMLGEVDGAPVVGEQQTRWEWIVANSEPTATDDLLVADPDATPVPVFDYAALGTEQLLVAVDPILVDAPEFIMRGAFPPIVHAGRVGTEGQDGPIDVYLVRATVGDATGICTAVFEADGGGVTCDSGTEPVGGIIGGIGEASYRDFEDVSLWVPRETALVVVYLKDGSAYTQRPVAGVGAMLIDLDQSGIDYVEALDKTGAVILRDDFDERRYPPPSSTTTTSYLP